MGKSNEVEDFEEHEKYLPSTSSPVNANIPKHPIEDKHQTIEFTTLKKIEQ